MGYKTQEFYDTRMLSECEARGDCILESLASGSACKSRYNVRHSCGTVFEVAYSNFTSSAKSGCPECRRVKWARSFFCTVAKDKPACVYRVVSECGKFHKVGVSTWAIEQRLIRIRAATPFAIKDAIELLFQGTPDEAIAFEQDYIAAGASAGFRGFCGATEWLLTK